MIVLLACLVAVMLVLLVIAGIRIENLQHEINEDSYAEHAKCLAHVASVTSNRAVADALRHSAYRYDTPEGQRALGMLRESYWPTGPSVPAMWIRAEADRIERGE